MTEPKKIRVEPLPEHRRSRTGDPRTAVEASRRAAKASLPAMRAVEALMQDGVERNDEEIWRDVRLQGFLRSSATVRHARLALSESFILIDTGKERPTLTDKCPSIVWVLNSKPPAFVLADFSGPILKRPHQAGIARLERENQALRSAFAESERKVIQLERELLKEKLRKGTAFE